METPLSDDEKRALLAEAIKTSNVDPEALAAFVRTNCPTYDMLAVQLPNGRSLHQCTQALERMLEPKGENLLSRAWQSPPPLAFVDTVSSAASPHDLTGLYSSSGAIRITGDPALNFVNPSSLHPRQSLSTQSPRPSDATLRLKHRLNIAQNQEWIRKLKPLSKSQPAKRPLRDDKKDTSNIGDANHHPLHIKISTEPESSSSITATPPKRIVENTSLTTDEICNTVLKAAFSTSLDELDTPTEVWESVYHCVCEISHIIGRHNHHTAQNAPTQRAGSDTTGIRGSYRHRPAKRQRRATGAPDEFGGDDDGEDVGENDQGANPNEGAPNMKQRRYAGLGCPFRKRNPLRFNVRSHLNCSTQTFSSITLLKRHVINFHKRPAQPPSVTCARCGEGFSTQADLDGHLRAESGDMCRVGAGVMPVSAPDPEDGIGPEVLDRMRDRTAKRQVLDWATLWKVLFPGDDMVPGAEFNPVVELDEVEAIFQNELDTLPPALRGRLQTAIELSYGIPAATALAEAACHVFTGFFAGITQKSRATLGPVVKTRQHNRPALPPSTRTTVATYSDAPGHGQLPSFIPAPDTAHPSLCSDCFQPESTSCTCFHIPALELDFDPTIWSSSGPDWCFASS